MASSANPSRATPRLQTSSAAGSSRQQRARFSWDETPQEMQRQPYPAPSPTNSTIEESPISPVSPTNGLPSYDLQHNARSTPLPDEKALEANMQAPPSRMHPAYSAPIAEEPVPASPPTTTPAAPPVLINAVATPQDPAQSPGPLPVKKHENGYAMTPLTNSTTSPQPSKYTIEGPDAYNPRSLQGPNVSTANHRPGQVAHPNSFIDSNWKHGMCEPDASCCMGIFCPCLLYGKTMYRLSRRSEKKDPTDLLGYESCNGSCGLFAIGCGFQGILAAIHRTRIRTIYKIDGSFGTDCLKACYCCCCVVAQNEREVKEREQLIRQHAGPSTGAYVAPSEAMTYAPPPKSGT